MFGRTDAQLRAMAFTDMMPEETAAEAAEVSQQFTRGTLDTGQVETDAYHRVRGARRCGGAPLHNLRLG